MSAVRKRAASVSSSLSLRERVGVRAGAARARTALTLTTTATLLLAACGSLAPPHQRPDLPVAAAYPQAAASAAEAAALTPAADLPWQQFFTGDARLQRLIDLALTNNRDLRVAVLNIERAQALYRVQRADRLPTLDAGATAQRGTARAGQPGHLYTAGLSVSAFELDLFGRVKNLSDAALARYFATAEARKAAQISLIASVASVHLAVLADDALLALTEQTLQTRKESLGLTKLRYDNGVVSELDYRQAESLVENARATLAQLKRQRAQDGNALVLLVGAPLPNDLSAAPDFAALTIGPELPAGLPSDLLTRRPDVRQAEEQLRATEANIGAARAAFFPRITLTGSAGMASTELGGLFGGHDGGFAWSFMPQIVLPIFDAGRNRANLGVAKAERDIAVAQYERAIQAAFRDVADALAGRATLGEQLRAQQAQAQAEAKRFELSDLRYRNGVASYLDLLDAQRSLFAAQQAVLQVRLLHLQNQVQLYSVLGGGWTQAAGEAQPVAMGR